MTALYDVINTVLNSVESKQIVLPEGESFWHKDLNILPRLRDILNKHQTEAEEPALKAALQKFLQDIDDKEYEKLKDIITLLSNHEEFYGKVFQYLLNKYPHRIDNNSLLKDTLFVYNQHENQSDLEIMDLLLRQINNRSDILDLTNQFLSRLYSKWEASDICKAFVQKKEQGAKYFLAGQNFIKKDFIEKIPSLNTEVISALSNWMNSRYHNTLRLLSSQESIFSWVGAIPETKADTDAWKEVKKALEDQLYLRHDVEDAIYAVKSGDESGVNEMQGRRLK